MNVKKESLRDKILEYLSNNPRAEVKDIASYVKISKQALYYHIKLLSKHEKITIVDSHFINGIEKKFYSLNIARETNKSSKGVLTEEEIPNSNIVNDKKSSPSHTNEPIRNETQLSLDSSTIASTYELDTSIKSLKDPAVLSNKSRSKGNIQSNDAVKTRAITKKEHTDLHVHAKYHYLIEYLL